VLPDAEVYLPLEQQTSSSNTPRWGHGAPNHPFIEEILAEQADFYRETLDLLRRYGRELSAIDRGPGADLEPRSRRLRPGGLRGGHPRHAARARALRRTAGGRTVDAFRELHPEEQGFTWWDYRQGHFHRKMGLRLDAFLLSPPLASRLEGCGIDRGFRKGPKPSDHAPLIAELG